MEAPPLTPSFSPTSLLIRHKNPSSVTTFSRSPNIKNRTKFSIRASSSSDSGLFSHSTNTLLRKFVFFFWGFDLVTHSHFIYILVFHFLVVTLLDYGAGNVRSVRNAIKFLGFEIKDVSFLVHFLVFVWFCGHKN
jgi:hypothetical protein